MGESSTAPPNVSQAFLWENGTMTQLDVGGKGSVAVAISDEGTIVGTMD